MNPDSGDSSLVYARAGTLAHTQNEIIWRRTDGAFARLMVYQWIGAVVLALSVSPQLCTTVDAKQNLWAAVLLGGVIAAASMILALRRPGQSSTRHTIAAGQMVMGALLIHLTGGRIETHFHVFGSLAFLAFYRDPKVLLTATLVVAIDHLACGYWWPLSVYGLPWASLHRTVEHIAWVLFENIFLVLSIRQSQGDVRAGAMQQARLEALSTEIESRVVERTAELNASERRAQIQVAALQAAANGVLITNRKGEIVWVNPAVEKLTGYSAAELVGKNPRVLKSGHHPPEFYHSLWQTISAGQIWQGEIVNRRKDGTLYDEEMTITPVRDLSGEICRFVAIKQDVTARRQKEQALSESEKRFRELVESTSDLVPSITAEGRLAYANPAWYRTLGYEVDLAREPIFQDFIAPESREDCAAAFRCAQQSDALVEINAVFLAKDGRRIYLEGNAHRQQFAGRAPVTQAILRDCTARRETEARLQDSEERFRLLVENSNDLFVLARTDGTIVYASPNHGAITGRTAAELEGTVLTAHIHPDDLEMARRKFALEEAMDEARIEFKDGSWHWLAVSGRRLVRKNGETLVGVVSRDITDRKRAEAAIAQSCEIALESARLKSEFLANMSHEIRTPMNGVIGMLNLLTDTPLPDREREFAEVARASAESLLIVLNDILDFSKIEAGKLSLENIDFDLRELVESTLELLAERGQAKGLEVIGMIDQGTPTALRGDPSRLRQILLNLIGNAIKFTDQGEVVLRTRVETDATGRFIARFEIRDTGIGISTETQARLFQPFIQADGSTTRRFGGTGLGLAISRRLVELMHGEIGVRSENGQGSLFWFTVPFTRGAEKSAPNQQRGSLAGQKVLIVDDNATNRVVFHHQILGWHAIDAEAVDSFAALGMLRAAAAANEPFSLALLDLQMPGMDGLELARTIKADPKIASTRLIMLTSLGAHLEENVRRAAGIDECLFKPVRQARLFDSLRRSMGERAPIARERLDDRLSIPPPSSALRVLLAEDNPVNQKVALSQLRKLGYSADVVGNGRLAVDAHVRAGYDVILMDCQMPEMEGYEATGLIRLLEAKQLGGAGRSVYIIALTAHALEGDREKCLASGMDDYVSKPVKLAELSAALTRASEQRSLSGLRRS